MFILTFQSYSEVPHKRSEFYEQVFDTLFSTHDSISKMAYVREKRSGLSKDQFEEVLKLFSSISFFQDAFVFPMSYISDQLNYIKEKKPNLRFDNNMLVDDLQIAIGILNKDGLDYSFPHRSLQEFFAVSYIRQLSSPNKEVVYKKMMQSVLLNLSPLLDRAHFYNLLSEVDYADALQYFAIPLLEDAYYQLNKSVRSKENDLIFYFTKVYMLLIGIINSKVYFNDFFCKYTDGYSSGIRLIIIDKIAIRKKRPIRHMLEVDAKEHKKIADSGRYFKKNGQALINKLKQYLSKIDESDSDIINGLI